MCQFPIEFLGQAFSYSWLGMVSSEGLVALERGTTIDKIMPVAGVDTGQ